MTVSAIFINLLLDNESSRGGSGSGQDSTQLLVCVSVWLEVVSAKKRTVLAHLEKFSDLAETFRVVRYICWE